MSTDCNTVCADGAARLGETARRLLGEGVGVAALDPRTARGELLSSERPAIARAVETRRREFLAGRLAARRAMAELGLPARAVPSGADRAPVWPEDLVGSITHTHACCLAVVARGRTHRAIGIDLETDAALPDGLEAEICRPEEVAWLAAQPVTKRGRLAKILFSAKEAAYKAQYPLTRTLFGFDALRVRIELGNGRFEAGFMRPVGPFAAGARLSGRLALEAGQILTTVALRA